MALIKLTAFMDNISGKVNGSVFAKNRGGNYVRSKSKPVNPRTNAQMAVRALFGAIASAWRSLTENQRNSWNESAPQFPYINRLGDTKTLSGFALHQKLNRNMQLIGGNTLTVPPPVESPVGIKATNVAVDNTSEGQVITVKITPAEGIVEESMFLVYATGSISPGRENFESSLRLIGTITGGEVEEGSPVDMVINYENVFGTPQVGAKIGFKIVAISTLSGLASAPSYVSTIAVDTSE